MRTSRPGNAERVPRSARRTSGTRASLRGRCLAYSHHVEDGAWATALLFRAVQARDRARELQKLTTITRARHQAHVDALTQLQAARAAFTRVREQAASRIEAWLDTHRLVNLAESGGDHDVAGRVLRAAQELFGCGSISVTAVDQLGGTPQPLRTTAHTGIADALDAAQYRLREGPCIEAVELDMVADVRAADFAATPDRRSWPRLAETATALGVRSAMSIAVPWSAGRVGLHAEQWALGAINLYAPEPGVFIHSERDARLLAAWALSISAGLELAAAYLGHDFVS